MQRFYKKIYLTAGLGLLFVLVSLLSDTWLYPAFYHLYTRSQAERVQKLLVEKQKNTEEFLRATAAIPLPQLQASFKNLYEESNQKHISLYISSADGGIVFYSTNSVFPSKLITTLADSQLQRLNNGYYLQENLISNGLIYIALIPIQY